MYMIFQYQVLVVTNDDKSILMGAKMNNFSLTAVMACIQHSCECQVVGSGEKQFVMIVEF